MTEGNEQWRRIENLRSVSLSSSHHWGVASRMQASRVLASRDQIQQKADAQLFVLAAFQVRTAAGMALRATISDAGRETIQLAIERFDRDVPGLVDARHALVHFDEYDAGVGWNQAETKPRHRDAELVADLAQEHNVSFEIRRDTYILTVGGASVDVMSAADSVSRLRNDCHHGLRVDEQAG